MEFITPYIILNSSHILYFKTTSTFWIQSKKKNLSLPHVVTKFLGSVSPMQLPLTYLGAF
jgi:hypothetical protein